MTRIEAQQRLAAIDAQWKATAADHDKALAPAIAKVRAAGAKLDEAKRDRAVLGRAKDIDRIRYERERQSLVNALQHELADPRIAEVVGHVDATLRQLGADHVPASAPNLLARVDRLLAARPRLMSYRMSAPANVDEEIRRVLADCV